MPKLNVLKVWIYFALSIIPNFIIAQHLDKNTKNVFIVTIDGLRWQEIFRGTDSLLIHDINYTEDTMLTKELYWEETEELRRKRLMPFFWNTIAKKGNIYGNRNFDNQVNVENLYKISYPGYNEILSGNPDIQIFSNRSRWNRNPNILEQLNEKEPYKGHVVAFTSWELFPYILNTKRNQLPLSCGYNKSQTGSFNDNYRISSFQKMISNDKCTREDVLTFIEAKDYIIKNHPKVVLLGFGETDEAAHDKKYDEYLSHIAMIDKLISELWYFIQTDPNYKNNTSIIITTDHGRGNKTKTWHKHNMFTKGSEESWLAVMGPDWHAQGEIKTKQTITQSQIAITILDLLDQKSISSEMNPKIIEFPLKYTSDILTAKR